MAEPLEGGTFTLSGEPATLSRSRIFSPSCGAFELIGEPATFAAWVVEVGLAKFTWQAQGLIGIVPAPARSTFYWRV